MGCGVSKVDCVVEPNQQQETTKEFNGGFTVEPTPIKNGGVNHKHETMTTIRDDVVVANGNYQHDGRNEQSAVVKDGRNIDNSNSSNGYEAKKAKLYTTVDIFSEVDQVALNAPPGIACSMNELVDYLLKNIEDTELFKVRVIWRWITHNISYDVDSYFDTDRNMSYSENVPDVLISGKSVCTGYSNLFKGMGQLAGIEVECIPGWSKGYAFVIGKSFSGTQTNHLWNAAKLDGSWWLFDCTWGAGYIDNNKNFVAEYDEHFFMTNPKQFIYDHFPNDPSWQLLDNPVSMEGYENMALFTKCFFNLSLKPVNHEEYLINCDDGKVHLKFKIDKNNPIKCVGSLINKGDDSHVSENYLHIYTTDKVLHCFVTAPEKGEYILKLFAESSDLVSDEYATLPLVCTYLLKFSVKTDSSHTYPKQFKKWCHGFMLHSPIKGDLCIGETYPFKVSVTDVSKMAVCLGGKKSTVIYMENTSGNIWEESIKIGRGTERITVVAKFLDSRNTTFSSILEYTVNNNICILSEH